MTKYIILLLFIITKSYSQNLDKTITKPDYTIKYNSEWLLDETKRNGVELYLFYSSEQRKPGNNINLLIQDIKGMNLNLDSYTEISTNQINANGKLISKNKKSLDKTEFQELTFTAVFNNTDLKFLQYYFLKEDKAYILTFTALETDFESLLPKATEIMNSFRI